jgi:hypothetical protein
MMRAYKYNLNYAKKEGYDFIAPDSYWDATEEEIAAVTGGCGPGRLGDFFVPDTIWGESIFLACQIHDWMYHTGETSADKRVADKVFMWNMLELVDDGELLDSARLRRVMTYYQAVSFGGGDCFDKGGENATD